MVKIILQSYVSCFLCIKRKDEDMSKDVQMEELREEIEIKRKELNRMIIEEVDKEELLKFSVELDNLIGRYYKLESNRK